MTPKTCCTPRAGQPRVAPAISHHIAGSSPSEPPVIAVPTAEPIRFANIGHTAGMIHLPGGCFLMGTDSDDAWDSDGEGPVREVTLKPFLIDACAVTNNQFAQFIAATKYKTDAEHFGFSFVFSNHLAKKVASRLGRSCAVLGLEWWIAVSGARWDRPEGERSNLKERMDHPVVHVSWNDAIRFCQWSGKRLATETEWEFAARGGLTQAIYPWGNTLMPLSKHQCNIWQGKFPQNDTGEDGFTTTCPVDSFAPNGYGLLNCAGNVWEWTNDWYCPRFHIPPKPQTRLNPTGPPDGTHKLQKGGSFLCHRSYCNRYRVAARTANTPDSSTANSGFRCARDP